MPLFQERPYEVGVVQVDAPSSCIAMVIVAAPCCRFTPPSSGHADGVVQDSPPHLEFRKTKCAADGTSGLPAPVERPVRAALVTGRWYAWATKRVSPVPLLK